MAKYTFDIKVVGIQEFTQNYIVSQSKWYNHPEYYLQLELSTPHIKPYYLLVKKNEKVIATVYLQVIEFPLYHLMSRMQKGIGFLQAIIYCFIQMLSKKKWLVSSFGNLFFTPDNGWIFEKNTTIEEKKIILQETQHFLENNKEFENIKAFMFSNFTENNYLPIPKSYGTFDVDPSMYFELDKQWSTFKDYLTSFTSKYRVRANKVFEKSKNITHRQLSNDEILSYKDTLYELYKSVAENADFNMSFLGNNYFQMVKKELGDLFIIDAYFLEDKMIGFSSFFIDNKVLHIHYIGIDYNFNNEYKLYHKMLFDFVEYGINQKVDSIDFGRTATEIKSTLGAIPIPMKNFIKLNNRFINVFIHKILKNFSIAPYTIRHPFHPKSQQNP